MATTIRNIQTDDAASRALWISTIYSVLITKQRPNLQERSPKKNRHPTIQNPKGIGNTQRWPTHPFSPLPAKEHKKMKSRGTKRKRKSWNLQSQKWKQKWSRKDPPRAVPQIRISQLSSQMGPPTHPNDGSFSASLFPFELSLAIGSSLKTCFG